jgi:hypothetical protein
MSRNSSGFDELFTRPFFASAVSKKDVVRPSRGSASRASIGRTFAGITS